ncbi:MAG: phosphatidate cytidylyltransferase [Chloroflexota bacterium]
MADLPRRTVTALVYGAVVLAAVAAPPIVFALVLVVAGAVSLAELVALRRAGPVAAIQGALVVIGLLALWVLRGVSPSVLLVVLFATWAADVFAYLGGSRFGRHKIAPRISPGKTWEGTLIGFVAAGVVFLVMSRAFGGWYPLDIVVAMGIGPVAFAGDMLESWTKRRAGVKDSGSFLPGHGGMLDRIDSLVATAPFVLLPLLIPCCAPSLG